MNYTFLLYGGFCFLGLLFNIFIILETKGKTEAECLDLYSDAEIDHSFIDDKSDNDDFKSANKLEFGKFMDNSERMSDNDDKYAASEKGNDDDFVRGDAKKEHKPWKRVDSFALLDLDQ